MGKQAAEKRAETAGYERPPEGFATFKILQPKLQVKLCGEFIMLPQIFVRRLGVCQGGAKGHVGVRITTSNTASENALYNFVGANHEQQRVTVESVKLRMNAEVAEGPNLMYNGTQRGSGKKW